jgi:excinuclease ABC subunit C
MKPVAEKIDAAPALPGVYVFKDAEGKAIYIGKARSLADRLRAYVGEQADARHRSLVSEAADVDLITTDSEIEALVLEENLIKLNKPRYNVRLKDDKKFPYVKLTVQDRFPGLYLTRNLKPDGSIFFGPCTNAKNLRKALKGVQRIFQLRACRKPLPLKTPERACLNRHMGRCLGPCQGDIRKSDYQLRVKAAIAFLSGRRDELEAELEKMMWSASNNDDFEAAASIRDQLLALREIRRRQQAIFGDKVSRDAVGLVLAERSAHAVVLKVREGKLIGKESYNFTITKNTKEPEVLETLLRSFYGHTYDLPREILVPWEIEEVETFVRWFKVKRQADVAIFKPDRGAKRKLLELARRNAEREFTADAHVPRVPAANLELGRILGLKDPPRRIEGIDISNISGRQAVGSLVVFSDNRPLKTEYRKFRIRTVAGPDDYAMLTEVLRRRVKRVIEEEKPFPDLVLVDGGKGQLSAALKVYQELPGAGGVRRDASGVMPILGFAKRTDLVYYADGREIQIPVNSPALRLLKQVRDEAHRFAIAYHRKLRGKAMTDSLFDHLPGVGERRKVALIRHFGTAERLKGAGLADLRQVPGIGKDLAEKIYNALHG